MRSASRVLVKFLQVMQKHSYIGEFEIIDDHRSGKIIINLKGRINDTINEEINYQKVVYLLGRC